MAGRIRWNFGARVLAGLFFALVTVAPAAPAAAQESGVGIVVLPFARGAGVRVETQLQAQLAEKLGDAILKSPKLRHLRVVEHSRLRELFARRRIEASGYYSQEVQSEIAGLLRAQYLLLGTIEKAVVPRPSRNNGGLLDIGDNKIEVQLNVALVEPTQGRRLDSWTKVGNSKLNPNRSLVQASQEAVNEIAKRMEESSQVIGLKPDPTTVRGVRGIVSRPEPDDDILIKASGVVEGGRYQLVRVVDERDETGKVFFTDRKTIGIVQVTAAQAEGAKLKLVSRTGDAVLAKGDVIELLAAPAGR